MTVNTTDVTSGPYTGNNIADTFSYTFRVEDKTQLIVYETDLAGVVTTLVVDTDYTVNDIGDDDGGTIERLDGPLPTGYKWYIRSNYEPTQDTAFASQGGFFPAVHESAFDKLTFLIQQLTDKLSRTLRYSDWFAGGEDGAILPEPEAHKIMRWKSDLTGLENIDISTIDPDAVVIDDYLRKDEYSADTIAALATKTGDVGDVIYMKQHTADGVGGGHFQLFSGTVTTTPDQTNASEAGKYWKRVTLNAIRDTRRDVHGLCAPAFSFAALPDGCAFQKLRTDFPEFSVYTPLADDIPLYMRWLFTNRFNLSITGASGSGGAATRMMVGSLAGLFVSTVVDNVASNKSSGTTTTAATTTYASSSSTNTGTWTAPATVSGITDVSYSTTVGDTRVYTCTGDTRLTMRGLNAAGNGGVCNVKVFTDVGLTTEITEDQYWVPLDTATGRRLVSFVTSSEGLIHVPVAKGLTPASTYYLRIEVDATNGSGKRIYQAGILGYAAAIAYNAVSSGKGIHGVVDDAELPGGSGQINSRSYQSGTTAVYLAEDCTRIDWDYVSTGTGSIVQFIVYDSTGAEITAMAEPVAYENQSIDTYQLLSSTARRKRVVSGLPKADYYIHVINGKTRNAGNTTAYRYYDNGIVAIDETTVAEVGVGTFDNNDIPLLIQDPNNDSGNGSEYVIIGTGNLELAIEIRKPAELPAAKVFVGGTHGYETTPTITLKGDDVTLDYAGAAQYDFFYADRFAIEFTTTLKFPVDATDFATVVYKYRLSKVGYAVNVRMTTLADAYVHDFFSIMLNCPSTAANTQGAKVGGGFKYIIGDKNYTQVVFDGTGEEIAPAQDSYAFVNGEYIVCVNYTAPQVQPDSFLGYPFEQGNNNGLIQYRTDRTLKVYRRFFNGDEVNGILVPSGTVVEFTKMYKVAKGPYEGLVGVP